MFSFNRPANTLPGGRQSFRAGGMYSPGSSPENDEELAAVNRQWWDDDPDLVASAPDPDSRSDSVGLMFPDVDEDDYIAYLQLRYAGARIIKNVNWRGEVVYLVILGSGRMLRVTRQEIQEGMAYENRNYQPVSLADGNGNSPIRTVPLEPSESRQDGEPQQGEPQQGESRQDDSPQADGSMLSEAIDELPVVPSLSSAVANLALCSVPGSLPTGNEGSGTLREESVFLERLTERLYGKWPDASREKLAAYGQSLIQRFFQNDDLLKKFLANVSFEGFAKSIGFTEPSDIKLEHLQPCKSNPIYAAGLCRWMLKMRVLTYTCQSTLGMREEDGVVNASWAVCELPDDRIACYSGDNELIIYSLQSREREHILDFNGRPGCLIGCPNGFLVFNSGTEVYMQVSNMEKPLTSVDFSTEYEVQYIRGIHYLFDDQVAIITHHCDKRNAIIFFDIKEKAVCHQKMAPKGASQVHVVDLQNNRFLFVFDHTDSEWEPESTTFIYSQNNHEGYGFPAVENDDKYIDGAIFLKENYIALSYTKPEVAAGFVVILSSEFAGEVSHFCAHDAQLDEMIFLANGLLLTACHWLSESRLWQPETGEKLHEVRGYGAAHSNMICLPNNFLIAKDDSFDLAVIMDPDDRELHSIWSYRDEYMARIIVRSDGQIITSNETGSIKVWGIEER